MSNEFSYSSFGTYLKFPEPTPSEIERMCKDTIKAVLDKVCDSLFFTYHGRVDTLATRMRAMLNSDVSRIFGMGLPFVGKGPHYRVFWTADLQTVYIAASYYDVKQTFVVELFDGNRLKCKKLRR